MDKDEAHEISIIKNKVAQLEKLAESSPITDSELECHGQGLQKIMELEKLADGQDGSSTVAITDELESIRISFLWGIDENKKKIHWVSRDKVVAPKSKGGLGVGSICALNMSLIVKWWWRLKDKDESLWGKVIKDAGLNDDLAKLNEELSDIRLVNGGDRWSCIIDSDGRLMTYWFTWILGAIVSKGVSISSPYAIVYYGIYGNTVTTGCSERCSPTPQEEWRSSNLQCFYGSSARRYKCRHMG
uniref:Reverse transcriptase zinc-binding domain-containing protein n=1 Tax=Lactuca sativa TaxID=4236 RepID=A0A9R1WPZ1_LACSA|nr:hypothetical protein LSAT_V11C100002300 [Lactuca sativa]